MVTVLWHMKVLFIVKGNSRGLKANVQGYDIIVSEFELQLHDYVHFRPNILILPAIGLNSTECLDIHETHMTANNSSNNNVVFFFVSDLKIVYYNNK